MRNLKKEILLTDLPQIVRYLKKLSYQNEIYCTSIYEACYELGYTQEQINEAIKLNNAYYQRRKRIKNRINQMVEQVILDKKNYMLFLTFTLNEDHVDMKLKTLRVYLQRLLNNTCLNYVANLDYGSLRGRLHFHAVVLVDKAYEWFELWKERGYVKIEHIEISEHSVNKVSKYVAKLSAHGLKDSTRFESLIYKRKVKN